MFTKPHLRSGYVVISQTMNSEHKQIHQRKLFHSLPISRQFHRVSSPPSSLRRNPSNPLKSPVTILL